MAPELVLCLDDYDNAVDIFSFSIIFLSLLVLKIPRGDGPSEPPPFTRIVPGFGLDPTNIENELPHDLPLREKVCELIKSGTNEDPKKRISLKDTLAILKEAEAMTVKKLREENTKSNPALFNVGVLTSIQDLSHNPHQSVVIDEAVQTPDTIESNRTADIEKVPNILQALSASRQRSRALSAGESTSSASNYVVTSSTNSLNKSQAATNTVPRIRHDIPHRFTIVFSPIALHSMRCDYCLKSINTFMHSHLECDDCGFKCHKKCSLKVPSSCGLRVQAMDETIRVMNTTGLSPMSSQSLSAGTKDQSLLDFSTTKT